MISSDVQKNRSKPDTSSIPKPAEPEANEAGEHSYYYDDSYGYEDFDPDSDEASEEDIDD